MKKSKQEWIAALDKHFLEYNEIMCSEQSKLEFISDTIFMFVTYDSEISEEFALMAIRVCKAINEGTIPDLINDEPTYKFYLIIINTAFFYNKIDWGTSVRGAFWGNNIRLGSAIEEFEVDFNTNDWSVFIDALCEWSGAFND